MTDVLIVGAGPTGLIMAIELKRRGLSVQIIDKNPIPSDCSKAIAIQARSLEIFDQIGVIEPFLKEGIPIQCANVLDRGRVLARIELSHLDSPYPFILGLEQNKTERILQEHLTTLGVEIERGVELFSFEQHEESITATLSNGQVSVAWLIGCDGAHSATRKALGFPFEGKTLPQVFSLADVQIDWDFPHDEFFLFSMKKGILVVIPLPEAQRYRVVFQSTPTLEEVQRLLCTYATPHCKVSEPRWLTTFSINSRMTQQYAKGRVFLAGDAAHIHSPAGGQGMNTGLQDAYNLAWKLALVHQGKATPKLLDTYDLERHYIARRLLKGTEVASWFGTLQNLFAITLRNWLLSKISRFAFVNKIWMRTISQIGFRYPRNLAVGRRAGFRAPNVRIDQTDLYALCRGKEGFFVLLNDAKLAEEIQSPEVIPIICDVFVPEIYVIRPDRVVGCVSSDPAVIRAYFADIFQKYSQLN